jgi:hypothetical protein
MLASSNFVAVDTPILQLRQKANGLLTEAKRTRSGNNKFGGGCGEMDEIRYFDLPVSVAIKCVEQDEDSYGCYGCFFNTNGSMFSRKCTAPSGLICGSFRKDKKDVIFKLVQYREEIVAGKTLKEICIEEVNREKSN